MKTLYIGGTGEISYACILAGAALGHEVAVFNRGKCAEPLPKGVRQIVGDLSDDNSYRSLARENWDVVCQYKAYDVAAVRRDVDVFSGKIGQYVFISSGSVYRKPPDSYIITEQHPVGNQYWEYSRNKIACEEAAMGAHDARKFPVTLVRPSHTYRRNFPGCIMSGDEMAWRMLNKKPVIIHGDGTSLWTLTHATDYAWSFVRLLGKGIGETFHITNHMIGYSWNQIVAACAAALEVDPMIVHVPTDTLIRCKPDWTGPLLGDKAWPSLFHNGKVRAIVGEHLPATSLADGLNAAAVFVRARQATHAPDAALHALCDRIAAGQLGVKA